METSDYITDLHEAEDPLFSHNGDLSSLQNAGLIATTEESSDISSIKQPILIESLKKARFKTDQSEIEARHLTELQGLQSRIKLLESTNLEPILISNQAEKLLKDKIASLEAVITTLKLENTPANSRQEDKTRYLQASLAEKAKSLKGLAKLNNELLGQNSDLRVENSRLKSMLEVYGNTPDLDTETSTSIPHRGISKEVSAEVGRILNPGI